MSVNVPLTSNDARASGLGRDRTPLAPRGVWAGPTSPLVRAPVNGVGFR